VYIVTHFLPLGHFNLYNLNEGGIPRVNAPFLLFFILAMFVVEWWIMHPHRAPRAFSSPPARWFFFQACAYSIVFFGVFGHVDFIYFQF
jgi:hypothetical protein